MYNITKITRGNLAFFTFSIRSQNWRRKELHFLLHPIHASIQAHLINTLFLYPLSLINVLSSITPLLKKLVEIPTYRQGAVRKSPYRHRFIQLPPLGVISENGKQPTQEDCCPTLLKTIWQRNQTSLVVYQSFMFEVVN